MKKLVLLMALSVFGVLGAFAGPVVDGKVAAGEYPNTKSLVGGAVSLNWAPDGQGGLFVALAAKARGWVGVGLGSQRMNGAAIYLGLIDTDGKAVFSEQVGKGHRHTESGKKTADQFAVITAGKTTVMEFHLPATNLPFTGKSVPFLVSFSNSTDLVTFHEDNYDSGTFTLP